MRARAATDPALALFGFALLFERDRSGWAASVPANFAVRSTPSAAAGAFCEIDGRCSVPDGECPSRRRYVHRAGGASDACVGVSCASNPIRTISGGGSHACLLRADGAVLCWGRNDDGQLGDGTRTPRSVPVRVLDDAIALAAGERHTCAVRAGGTVACWGADDTGQLGDGGGTPTGSPRPPSRPSPAPPRSPPAPTSRVPPSATEPCAAGATTASASSATAARPTAPPASRRRCSRSPACARCRRAGATSARCATTRRSGAGGSTTTASSVTAPAPISAGRSASPG